MTASDTPKPGKKRRAAKILFTEGVDGHAKTAGSKILFGAKPRTRIPCTLPELKALEAEASNGVLKQAMKVVERVNLDDMYFEDVIKFGAELQAEHAEITERDLELARESALPEAHRLHVEILAKLRDLNPSKVFGLNENMLQRLWRRLFGGGLTVAQVFAQHYPQVEALATALDALEPTLADQLSGLAALSQRYDQLNVEISGYILAVRYIYGYIYGDEMPPEKRALYISHIDAIMDRQDSLRITQVTLTSGQLNTALSIKNMERLMAAGRRLLDQNLPSFQTAYSVAIAAKRRAAGQDKSWLRGLRDSYNQISDTLKGE